MYGWRGREYSEEVYEVPQIRIGGVTFHHPHIQEEHLEFSNDSLVFKLPEDFVDIKSGRLGWKLFCAAPLLLIDLSNCSMSFCDSIETLRKYCYPLDSFVKTPLFLDDGLVSFNAVTMRGPLKCILDTGATWNVLHKDADGLSVEEMASESILDLESFKIEGEDLGLVSFHSLPIKLPIKIEAILGVEFFSKHIVIIDFKDKQLYISKIFSK